MKIKFITDWRKKFYEKAKNELIYHKNEAYFSWKNLHCKQKKKLEDASFIDFYGYCKIGFFINGKKFAVRVHTLVYYIEKGLLVENLDHIDRNPQNNHINNLRVADMSLQNKNRKVPKGKSGEMYIYLDGSENKPWRVRFHKGPGSTVGTYKTIEEAIEARDIYAKENSIHLL